MIAKNNSATADICPVVDPMLFIFVRILRVKLVSHFDLTVLYLLLSALQVLVCVLHIILCGLQKCRKIFLLCAKTQN